MTSALSGDVASLLLVSFGVGIVVGLTGMGGGELDKETLTAEIKGLLKEVNTTLEDHERLDYVVMVKDQWTM